MPMNLSLGLGLGGIPVSNAGHIASLGADLALWFDVNQAYKSSGGGVVTPASILTVARATAAWYFDAQGVLQQAANNTLRLNHDPVTLAPLGLLVEQQRTNLLLNSTTLSTQSVTVTAEAHTLSFYGTGTVTLSGVSTAGPLVGTGPNNRVSLTFTPTAGSLTLTVSGDVRMANLELGSFPTSPIITAGTQVTRNAEVISIATSAFPFNASAGTVVVEGDPRSVNPGASGYFAINVSGGNNDTYNLYRADAAFDELQIRSGGVTVAPISLGSAAGNTKLALAYAVNDFAISRNGAAVSTDTVGALPVGVNTLQIGTVAGGNFANGHIRRLAYYGSRKTNAELQLLSLVAYNPEAVAFWTRFTTPPADARKVLLSAFFAATPDQRAKLDLLYLLDAADNQAARQNLIADLYNLTAFNAPSFVTDRGYSGDNASAYLSSGYNPTTAPSAKFTLNGASMGVWQTGLASIGRNGNATARVGSETTPTGYIRANDTTTNNTAIAADARLISWTRTASGQYDIYINGTFLATVSVASTSVTNAVLSLLGIPGVSFGSVQTAMFFAGGSLTAGDHLAIYNATLAYHQGIGAA